MTMLMYSTCLYCNRPLGRNEAIEEFPIGQRLAYDQAKGRLWVVCTRCQRWNLSPLEVRWEAIEECERRFRETKLRASTDNIGLARLPEGLELVRIGRPERPEFAAWRYGDQFGARRKRAMLYTAAGVAAAGAIVVGGTAAGILTGGGWYGLHVAYRHLRDRQTIARLRDHDDNPIRVQRKHLLESRLLPSGGTDGWALEVAHAPGWRGWNDDMEVMRLEGQPATRIAGQLMSRVNWSGGREEEVQDAVRQIEESGHPEAYLRVAARQAERLRAAGATALEHKRRRRRSRASHTRKGSLQALPKEIRLAVEMATQEQSEREALEGELASLEAAWRAAEEVAAISDDLLVPEFVRDFIRRERTGDDESPSDGMAPLAPRPWSAEGGREGTRPR